jgi:hypothetical protein
LVTRLRITVPFDDALNGLLRVRKLPVKPVKRTRTAKESKVRSAGTKPRSR